MGQTKVLMVSKSKLANQYLDWLETCVVDPKDFYLEYNDNPYFGDGRDGDLLFTNKSGVYSLGREPNYTSLIRQSQMPLEEALKIYGPEQMFPELKQLRNALEDLL